MATCTPVRSPPLLTMTDPIARPSPKNRDYLLKVELEVRTSDPRLLDGLEVWLRLGLVSDAWVREVARQWLTCPLPVVAAPARETPPAVRSEDRPPAPIAPRMAHGLTSITAELSVVWLLLVGAFLVVVSSAWLAASLWSQVGVLGQYGILLLYTIVFWGAALWTDRQEKLRLTGRALRGIVTLLLPVNAWAADGLGLPLWGWVGAGALWAAIGGGPGVAGLWAALELGFRRGLGLGECLHGGDRPVGADSGAVAVAIGR